MFICHLPALESISQHEAARLLLRAYRELVDDSVALLNVSCEAVLSPGVAAGLFNETNCQCGSVITAVNGLRFVAAILMLP